MLFATSSTTAEAAVPLPLRGEGRYFRHIWGLSAIWTFPAQGGFEAVCSMQNAEKTKGSFYHISLDFLRLLSDRQGFNMKQQ